MQIYAQVDGDNKVIGFVAEGIHDPIPQPSIAISAATHAQLLEGQSVGKIMAVTPDGKAVLIDRPAPSLGQVRVLLCASIDAAADAARLAVAGDPLRAAEYQIAEAEAKAYRAAGYVGECPLSVKSWAEAKGWSSKQAADNIIAEANAWNAALYAIRDARLKAKEGVRNALTADSATAIASAAIDGIHAKIASLGNAAS
ncbi:hypothetical protein SAMN04488595_109200 [Ralstonia sp. 25mfcol4.1]|uniref:hypothetical protein n=1 Tax=Ralstonia sp. 25mfcol4.1 TaxID=1761899 RepID=UPI000880B2D5|nr:hypothetical protein [Ralstonia sp. 25mfcol4.1]SDP46059.1 hypothetical protein SAMN04488595_109200 [Ralstonia sp. 25mfcol4.1]